MAGLAATLAGAADAGIPEGEAQASATDREMVRMLGAIRDELSALRAQQSSCRMPMCGGLARIRVSQRQFLKGHQKFPDFLEVGADVWDELIDWHVRTMRLVEIATRPDGRYSMPFLQTTIILRPDVGDDYVGTGWDTRTGVA